MVSRDLQSYSTPKITGWLSFIDNSNFEQVVRQIYSLNSTPVKKSNSSNTEAPILYFDLYITYGTVSSKMYYTRGIWKILSMVLYLSNQFTNPIMFGIILKNYLSSFL